MAQLLPRVFQTEGPLYCSNSEKIQVVFSPGQKTDVNCAMHILKFGAKLSVQFVLQQPGICLPYSLGSYFYGERW